MEPHRLDVTGLLCPLPVLKARKLLISLPKGDMVEVRADDPASLVDMPHFCAEAGHRMISQSEEAGVFVYLIQRG